jgi:hypothetical protein
MSGFNDGGFWNKGLTEKLRTIAGLNTPNALIALDQDAEPATLLRSELLKDVPTKNGEGINWLTVDVSSGDPDVTGANLLAAYAAAKTLAPNGVVRTTENRAAVLLPPAHYRVGAPLILDAPGVDLVGVLGDPRQCAVVGAFDWTPAVAGKGAITVAADHIRIAGITCDLDDIFEIGDGDANTTLVAYSPQFAYPNLLVENCRLLSFRWNPALYASGSYVNCTQGNGPFLFGADRRGTEVLRVKTVDDGDFTVAPFQVEVGHGGRTLVFDDDEMMTGLAGEMILPPADLVPIGWWVKFAAWDEGFSGNIRMPEDLNRIIARVVANSSAVAEVTLTRVPAASGRYHGWAVDYPTQVTGAPANGLPGFSSGDVYAELRLKDRTVMRTGSPLIWGGNIPTSEVVLHAPIRSVPAARIFQSSSGVAAREGTAVQVCASTITNSATQSSLYSVGRGAEFGDFVESFANWVGSNRITSHVLHGFVTGVRYSGSEGANGDTAAYEIKALVSVVNGTVTLRAQTVTPLFESVAAWDCTVDVLDSASLRVNVIGAAGTTIRWTFSGTLTSAHGV